MKTNALFFTQPVHKIQITFRVLSAILPGLVQPHQVEAVLIGENAVVFEDRNNDVLHLLLLKDALIDAMA